MFDHRRLPIWPVSSKPWVSGRTAAAQPACILLPFAAAEGLSPTSMVDVLQAPVQVAQLPPVLAEVQYHMRLKGFMRPRKCGGPSCPANVALLQYDDLEKWLAAISCFATVA